MHDLVWYNRGQGVHRATHLDLGVLRSCAMAVVIFGIGYTTATLLITWCCCSPLFCHHDHSMGVAAPYLSKDLVWYNTIIDADDKGFRPWHCSFRETALFSIGYKNSHGASDQDDIHSKLEVCSFSAWPVNTSPAHGRYQHQRLI